MESLTAFFVELEAQGWTLPPLPSSFAPGKGPPRRFAEKGAGPYADGCGKGKGGFKGKAAFAWGEAAPPAEVSEEIFVGGLPEDCASEELIAQHFSQFGEVKQVTLKLDAQGRPRGFAFVAFASVDSARAVLDNHAANYIGEKWVDCKAAQRGPEGKGGKAGGKAEGKEGGKAFGKGFGKSPGKGKQPKAPWKEEDVTEKVFVGGLPPQTREEDVKAFAEQYGSTMDVSLKYNADNSFRGFAFVTMESRDSALNLLRGHEGCLVLGAAIECRPATPSEHWPGKQKGKQQETDLDDLAPTPITCNVVRVYGLPYEPKQRDTFKLFYNFSTTRFRDCGGDQVYVEFSSQQEAERAYRAKNGAPMGGSHVELGPASREEFEATAVFFLENSTPPNQSGDGSAPWTALVKATGTLAAGFGGKMGGGKGGSWS